MLKRERFLVFSWQKGEREFHEIIVLSPLLTNANKFAHQIFVENGVDVGPVSYDGNRFAHIHFGIPLATIRMGSSRSEINTFLLGVGARYGCWDYASVAAIKIDPESFFTPCYQRCLKQIEKSQSLRCSIGEFFGIER